MRQQTVKSASIIGQEDDGGMLLALWAHSVVMRSSVEGKSVIMFVTGSCAV